MNNVRRLFPTFVARATNRCLHVSLVLATTHGLFASNAESPSPSDPKNPPPIAAQPAVPNGPLSLAQCLDLALKSNPAILKSQRDIEESHGLSLQSQSTYLPRLQATGDYTRDDPGRIESVNFGDSSLRFRREDNWQAGIQVVQTLFAGGRLKSSARSATLTRQAALERHQALVNDTVLEIRTTYFDALLAAEQIAVQEASLKLLEQELKDTQRRFDAGIAPRFNVLRAEVEIANVQPRLLRARNSLNIAQQNLAVLLGWSLPPEVSNEPPLTLADSLRNPGPPPDLTSALSRALSHRSELRALRTNEKLRDEDVVQARSGYYPQLQGIAGYGWQNRVFSPSLGDEVHGWRVGAQMTWDVWNFGQTRGRTEAAEARRQKARIDTQDVTRKIETEVRVAHLNYREALLVVESQAKVIEQAEEALRLANARADAGTGTQLDVLSAQTALTQTRTIYSQALRDLAVANARLNRAIGDDVKLSDLTR